MNLPLSKHTCQSHCASWTCALVDTLFRTEDTVPRNHGSTGARYLREGLVHIARDQDTLIYAEMPVGMAIEEQGERTDD
jgi:hypothetical protein